ncbi:MAG: T9SS type A sorting domain-containing protein [Ferruginibacter sp.]
MTPLSNGKFLGHTSFGGANEVGTIFEYDYTTNTYTPKIDLVESDGSRPQADLVKASNGKFYGITLLGGANNLGVIYEYDYSSNTYTKKIDMTAAGGNQSAYTMVEAPNGKFYGTTYEGGANGAGVIFEYDYVNNIYTDKIDMVISDGRYPIASLFLAPNGKFYGVAKAGGVAGNGVIFEYDYTTNTYTKKFDFGNAATNGSKPQAPLMLASDGKLYGVTSEGGANDNGTVYQYDYTTNSFVKKTDLQSINGNACASVLVEAANGKCYATTSIGGIADQGVLFEYDFTANSYTKKKDLGVALSGADLWAAPVKANNGKIYFVSWRSGANDIGTIIEYDHTTNTYTKKYDFTYDDGARSYSGMTQANNGKLYGMTNEGGLNTEGTLYEYDYTTNTFTKKKDLLPIDGINPVGKMLLASNGKLYGTMPSGGANNLGVLFEYDYTTNTYTKLIDFSATNGRRPCKDLMEASNGKIYGATTMGDVGLFGSIFEYDYVTHTFTTKLFLNGTNGESVAGTFVEAANGKLYGATAYGGANNKGVIFEYDYTTNTYTKKFDFSGTDGNNPNSSLTRSQNGKLYGTTIYGGNFDFGVLFEYNYVTNTFTKKIDFDFDNGMWPNSAPIEVGTGCIPATQPVVSASSNVICTGSQVTLSIQNGSLNESDHWAWYSGSCGGTAIDTGSSITFTPTATDTYYVRGEGGCSLNGDCGDITITVSSSLTASVSIASNTGSSSCQGTSVTFTATPTNGGATPSYQWKKNGNDVGTDADTYTDASLNDGDAITCELTSSETCVSNSPVQSNTIVMTVNVPTSSVTNITVCRNELPYNWNGTDYSFPGTYQASFINAAGCDSTAFLNFSINQLPAAGITNNTGTTQISCAITSISVTATGGVGYLWSNGLGSNANATITAAGTYTVNVTGVNGCSAQATITITTNPNGPPAPAGIDGTTNVCSFVGTGDQLVYTATPVSGATSYQWLVPSTVNIISGQGTNTLTVTIANGFITSANKQLRVRAIAACGTSLYTIKYLVAQMPGSIPAITGPTDVCPYLGSGTEAVYTIPASAGATTYQWSVPPGAFITQDNGTNIRVVFINGFATGPISVFAINGCGQSNTRSLTVKLTLPSKPGVVSGPTNPCLFMPSTANPTGVTATYSVAKLAGITYNWAVPSGASIGLHGSTANTDYIEVNFTAAYTTGNISVTANNGCGDSPERIFTLTSHTPSNPSAITGGQTQACPDRQLTYSITSIPSNAVSAQWTVPAGASIVSGQGTTSVVISVPSAAFSGTVSVVGNNGCGNSTPRSVNINLPACGAFTRVGNSEPINKEKTVAKLSTATMEVNVFPNPTTTESKLQVLTAGKEKIKVRILDAQGRSFKTFEMMPYQTVEIGAGLKAGVYLVEVRQSEHVRTMRFIKF